MLPLKTIIRFFVFSLVIYVALIIRWPGLRPAYRGAYCAAGEVLFARFGSQGRVRYEPRGSGGLEDVDIVLGKRTAEGVGEAPVAMSTVRVGYVPLALLASLVLATPVPWARKWRALVWGLVLVNLFVVFRSTLQILYWFSAPSPIRLYELSPFWNKVLSLSYEFFFLAPGCSFLAPVVVWIVVTLRRGDINRILRPGSSTG